MNHLLVGGTLGDREEEGDRYNCSNNPTRIHRQQSLQAYLSLIQMHSLLSETSGNLDDLELTDSQMNEFFKQMQGPTPSEPQAQSDLQTLIQSTLFLDYDIFLAQEDLRFYRTILAEKDQQVKRVKERIAKKNAKVAALTDEVAKKSKKIAEVKQGYQKLKIQLAAATNNEGKKREQRLEEQSKKVALFQRCQQLEEICANLMLELEDYKQTEYQAAQLCTENQELKEEVEEIFQRRETNRDGSLSQRKDQLRNEVRRLYQKIKLAQKQDQSICQEYELNRRTLGDLQRQQDTLNAKNIEIQSLYSRTARIKQQVQSKRWQITTRQRQLFQLTREQSQLRRTAKDSPPRPGHNFRIIDSEADEDLSKTGQRLIGHYQSCNLESQEQLDQLISRFQKIKSRGKQ